MSLLRKIGGMALLLLLPMGVMAQSSSVADTTLSVAERNALQGFNDTIDRLAEDFVTVSLVVCEPGPLLFSAFGHVALRLQCPTYNLDNIFHYESEQKEGNWGRFLSGDLKMGMFCIPSKAFFAPYQADGRGIKEYVMHLTPTQEQDLWRIMDELAAKGVHQPYDYYNHGCAISIVHVIKQALHGTPIEYQEWPERLDGSMRELGYRCVSNAHFPWSRLALMTLAGSDIDDTQISKEKKLIVPVDLAEVWQNATVNGRPLLDKEPRCIVPHTLPANKTWCTPLLISIILLVLALISWALAMFPAKSGRVLGIVIDYSILTIVTLIGIIVTYTVLFSTLPCTEWNWLIIPFNILPIIGWYWRKYWALPYAVVVLVWCAVMTGTWLCGRIFVEWAHIIFALAFAIILLKQSSVLLPVINKK